ncbi:Fc.00g008340.m01.CDS01 [Cosmosporella sp. VM-42]
MAEIQEISTPIVLPQVGEKAHIVAVTEISHDSEAEDVEVHDIEVGESSDSSVKGDNDVADDTATAVKAPENEYKFEGWMGEDPSSAEGHMVWKEYEPKPWEESDVDIKITHSGICGSDIHTLRAGWGPTDFPCVVGHEIVGVAVRVGSEAEGDIKVGDMVGVGAQTDSCRSRDGPCTACESHEENYCNDMHLTYNTTFRNGGKAYGGYALYHRSPSHFVVKIPDGLNPAHAAPMLCGGVTVYSPLKVFGAGPGKRIGVVGVGGLGHFAVLIAKAMGVDKVVGISRRANKRDEALKLGCDEYIATEDDADWATTHANTLDLIICTVSSPKMPLLEYMGLLDLDGALVQVGIPEEPIPVSAWALVPKRRRLVGSLIGSPQEIQELFQLAADKHIEPWVETRAMSDANQAIIDMEAGKPRFRYVLTNQ